MGNFTVAPLALLRRVALILAATIPMAVSFPTAWAANDGVEESARGLEKARLATMRHIETLQELKYHVQIQAKAVIDLAIEESSQDLQVLVSGPGTGSGEGLETALASIEEHALRHAAMLRDLLEKVPPSAKPALERAIAASRHGALVAQEVLATLQSGGKPKGPPTAILSRPSIIRGHAVGRVAGPLRGRPAHSRGRGRGRGRPPR